MREKAATAFLWFAAIWWGIWLGGQLFNAMMVVPYFSHDVPGSLEVWGRMRYTNDGDFFVIFSTLWILLALIVAIALQRPVRRPAILSAIMAAISFAMLMVWMVPTIARLVSPAQGGLPLGDAVRLLRAWTHANYVRLLVELVGFISALKALTAASRPASAALRP